MGVNCWNYSIVGARKSQASHPFTTHHPRTQHISIKQPRNFSLRSFLCDSQQFSRSAGVIESNEEEKTTERGNFSLSLAISSNDAEKALSFKNLLSSHSTQCPGLGKHENFFYLHFLALQSGKWQHSARILVSFLPLIPTTANQPPHRHHHHHHKVLCSYWKNDREKQPKKSSWSSRCWIKRN